jgi:hypothetical protein
LLAIREADSDVNPAAGPDPSWTPLFASLGAPLLQERVPDALQGLLRHPRDQVPRDEQPVPREQRYLNRFSDAISEVIEARIRSRVDFRTADYRERGSVTSSRATRGDPEMR